MTKFICLGSGSCGNCYYINTDGYGLIIDIGIGIRVFRQHFRNNGLTIDQIKAILVTHDHTDHVKSVGKISEQFHIPVYATQLVHNSMRANHYISKKVPATLRNDFTCGETLQLGPWNIESFHVPHDSADNNGFIIRNAEICFVLMTDIGHFTDEMQYIVKEATHLVIESNYDTNMLENGPYPRFLKNRIASPKGHISNAETASFLGKHLNPLKIKHIWLCHLSQENNNPNKAFDATAKSLEAAGFPVNTPGGIRLEVLARRTPSLLIEL